MSMSVGIAGVGAIGSAVARALIKGIDGYELTALCDIEPDGAFDRPYVDFETLAAECDMVIECLPPPVVPALVKPVFELDKTLVLISSCALLIYPEIEDIHRSSTSRILVPSGALAGLDGVNALKELGIQKSMITSTKPPMGFNGAPHVEKMGIDLTQIKTKTQLFAGNALEAASGFPANVNVAATLSLAGIGAEKTQVEIWADPEAKGNSHEILVEGAFSTITARIENTPDPANPKSSMLAAQSIIALLKGMSQPIAVF